MFTALASLLTNRTVKSDTAMTGEISLRAWCCRLAHQGKSRRRRRGRPRQGDAPGAQPAGLR